MAHETTQAVSIEPRADRAARIRSNADRLGTDRLTLIEAAAPTALDGLEPPQAVFIGGGLSDALLTDLSDRLAPGTRLVAHAVTLESEARLVGLVRPGWAESCLRIDLAEIAPLGPKRGWKAAYPVTQWRVVL